VAATVLDEAARLDELVHDLLQLARADEAVMVSDPVDLDEVVLADAARLRSLGHAVTTDVGAARVLGDASQLARMVRNLVDNAARHGTSVSVRVGREGDDAVLRVDDDGPGIPEPERQRVFERFARLDEGRTRADGGTGLGLAVVAAVVARHRGRVVVATSPLGGSRFEVRLPLARVAELVPG
jgi:signal transduction histidine kinase